MKLKEYKHKRNFHKTLEPHGRLGKTSSHLYLIQKHAATRLHYDFRLALGGVLKSWAIPKGPSLNPADKRLAVHVEDHPLDYGSFEGTIPKGQYGGGTVMMWDRGEWEPEGDPEKGYAKGHLRFRLKGQRLKGRWSLICMGGSAGADGKNWLLVKEKDEAADPRKNPTEEYATSVITRRSMDEISSQAPAPKKRAIKPISVSSTLSLARPSTFPTSLKPQLATLTDEVPAGDEWIHEVKYDGYRLLGFVHNGRAKLLTRNGLDWTHRFSSVATAAEKLPVKEAIIDGEVVVQKEDGTTDFQALQNALKSGEKVHLIYYVFDLPYCDGQDLTKVPLIERKKLLAHLFEITFPKTNGTLRYSDHITGKGKSVFNNACHYALEGIISKRVDSEYHQFRSSDWLKVKCAHRQEFVMGGYTKPKGARLHFGSLLVGYYNAKGHLIYAGHVGTGFNETLLESLSKELKKREQKKSSFHTPVEDKLRRSVVWIKPELVGEIQFAGWTNDGILRHPSFEGLREDKKARDVVLERPSAASLSELPKKSSPDTVAGVALTHPDRVLYQEQGITKRDLCLYYEHVASSILPHVKGRPLSLVRCPRGEGKPCFFQKHFNESAPASIRGIKIKEKQKTDTYILVEDVEGLVSLVQLGVLEFHPWGSTSNDIERPDRLVFDLDPAPGVKTADLVTAARRVRDRLADLGLTSFVKTTGGKGLHVVAPVEPSLLWDDFKEFAGRVATDIVKKYPNDYVATMAKSHRSGKIFIDFFRNGRGATSVASYSTRARPEATVSTPLSWDELTPELKLDRFTIKTVPKWLAERGEAWRGFFEIKQRITT